MTDWYLFWKNLTVESVPSIVGCRREGRKQSSHQTGNALGSAKNGCDLMKIPMYNIESWFQAEEWLPT